MTIETAIHNFKLAMFDKPFEAWPELTYHSPEAFQMAQRRLGDMVMAARKAGYTIRHSGAENRKEKTAWNRISYGARVLTIRYAYTAKRAVTVQETSRAAYHSLDFSTQRGRVAKAILDAQEAPTRGEVAQALGLEKSTCTARIKELIDAPVMIDGAAWILTEGQPRKSKESGVVGNTLHFERYFEKVEVSQTSLF